MGCESVKGDKVSRFSKRAGRRCATAEGSLQKEMGMNVVHLTSISKSFEGVSGWDVGRVAVFLLNASCNFVA